MKWRDFDNLSNVGCGNALSLKPRRPNAETNYGARNDKPDRRHSHHGSSMMLLTASMSDFLYRELTGLRGDSFATLLNLKGSVGIIARALKMPIKDHRISRKISSRTILSSSTQTASTNSACSPAPPLPLSWLSPSWRLPVSFPALTVPPTSATLAPSSAATRLCL